MRLRRFTFSCVGSQPVPGDIVVLDQSQSHQAITVLRLTQGQKIELVGPWGLALAEMEKIQLRPQPTMWAKILTPFETLELASGPTLALSLIRGPRFDWAVEKATELGASTLVPLITNRSSPRASGEVKKSRWHRISEEARKQCGRPRPMMVLDPMTLGDWLASGLAGKKFLLDPGGPLLQCDSPAQVSLLVGPEGGLTNEEKQMALEVGFTSFSLGRLILRAETAAITALARLVGQLREDPIYQPNSSCPLVNFWKNV